MMLRFDDRVALVSGGGRGIGRTYARLLASRGCRIVIADAGFEMSGAPGTGDPAKDAALEIEAAGGTAYALRGDVATDADQILEECVRRFGRLDILINNAGPVGSFGLFSETSAAAWQRVVDIHYRGTVAMCRAAWPHLAAAGAGRIINTASAAMLGSERQTDYGSAKAAIFGFTRSLAIEGLAHGIHVNCVLPSGFTRMMETIPDSEIREAARRLLDPDHIAALVVWLVHHRTRITGEAVLVGGGRAARIVIASGPPMKVTDSTPEIWRDHGDLLFEETPLTRLTTMSECFATELRDLDPSIESLFDRLRETKLEMPKS